MPNHSPLVINWHLTEACNYQCRYCYAAWTDRPSRRELIHNTQKTGAFLRELYQFFQPGSHAHRLASLDPWPSVRINFAGGEPLLYSNKLPTVIAQARKLGFDVSMISNGSLLDQGMLDRLAGKLCWLGISIDSSNTITNHAIGRLDRQKRTLNLNGLASSLSETRTNHPHLQLKLNTVVNRLNHSEDFSAIVNSFSPDKWKVLRMLPVVNNHLAVSDQQFNDFVTRHQHLSDILCPENHEDMRESYVMIDPHGRFFQNSPRGIGEGYVYSSPIQVAGIERAFSEMTFNQERFNARYSSPR